MVWTFPFSLATTKGISSIYFPLATEMFHFARSSSYTYGFSVRFPDLRRSGFPHSDIPGSPLVWELPEAYRTLQRPSSSFSVKASTIRPYLIAHNKNTQSCFIMLFSYLAFVSNFAYFLESAFFSYCMCVDRISDVGNLISDFRIPEPTYPI